MQRSVPMRCIVSNCVVYAKTETIVALQRRFFNEINPFGFAKCLCAWVNLFHFTFCVSKKFYNDRKIIISHLSFGKYFII